MLFAIDTELITIDEKEFPDPDVHLLADHLQLYHDLNKDIPYPDIVVAERNNIFLVKKGHVFFQIIRDRKQGKTNARLETSMDSDVVQQYLQENRMTIRDWREEAISLRHTFPTWLWYVLFFEEQLQEEKVGKMVALFEEITRFALAQSVGETESDTECIHTPDYSLHDEGKGIAIRLFNRLPDEEAERKWAVKFHLFIKKIHGDVSRIASINGVKAENFIPYLND